MNENQIYINEIFNALIYLVTINIITFVAIWIDKQKAKKGKWRISETSLFILAILGGSIGGTIGMHMFRHKTKKARFTIGFPLIFILEIMIIIYYVFF